MHILTHRGLDPARKKYFTESSYEAFDSQIKRGFGLEFDLCFSKDNEVFVFHDDSLTRVSNGLDTRKISEMSAKEIRAVNINGCHLASLFDVLGLIRKNTPNKMCAIHLKYRWQKKKYLKIILETLHKINYNQFIVFDITVKTAKFLKKQNQKLNLAPSVAHFYDIKRYNRYTGGTLITIKKTLKNKDVFSWAWLDEWDLINVGGGIKKLYTKEVFLKLRNAGFKVAIISPELHALSPGLLGRERHQDAKTTEQLEHRLREITALEPDAICTDYPDLVKKLTLK